MKELYRLIPYLKRYKQKLILGLIVVTIANLCATYVPRLVGTTIDMIVVGNYDMNKILLNILYILLLTAFSGYFMFLTRKMIIVASREIEYDLRKDLLNSIQSQSMNFFHKNPTGNLMAHATNDIPAAREFLGPAIMYSANTVTTFAFALYFMLTLNPEITMIGLIPLPFIAYATYLVGKKIHIAFKDVQSKFAELTTQAQESISGVRVIRAYTREIFEHTRFAAMSKEYLFKNLRLAGIEAIFMPLLMVLVGLSHIAVLAYGGTLVINNQASLGDLVQFFIYLELLVWPVAAIGWVTNLIQRGAASSARLGKLLEEIPEIADNGETDNSIKKIEGEIEFDSINYKYPSTDNIVLDDISFRISKGNTLGIVGSVGTGKSTIINLLLRLFETKTGAIKIDGHNLKSIPIDLLRKHISVVPQEPFLFSDTIKGNISFGNPAATMEEIIAVAEKCKLHEEVLTFQNGYDTMLGERGITLSGGQKQRVSIARAMITNPSILILDDSLSAVDSATESFVLGNLKEFMKDRTTIIISHRISTVMNADNIILLDKGKIAESGNHEQLVTLNGKYANIFRLQQLAKEIEEL
ncbi:MAG: ABC transporter ATP-binding protein [Desulfobulbaceae bacterium]|nr:ABC transporter ATP-binding protein [Candidatus Kapabacteria bacterium]MBS4000395.1 ABC transporter ATP-binding protein [Desulfobulbaceae bacterium]